MNFLRLFVAIIDDELVAIIDKQYLPKKTLQIVVDYFGTYCNMGAITIQRTKKCIGPQEKNNQN
jgi:hypothetical protein